MLAEDITGLSGVWRYVGDAGALGGLDWPAVLALAAEHAGGDHELKARILDGCRWIESGALQGNARAITARTEAGPGA